MNRFFGLFLGILPFLSATAAEISTSQSSLDRLVQGNQRYVKSSTVCHEDWTAKRIALLEGQKPFAVILTCSDSRVPPEIVFDQTLGDLFVVRVAGNIVDDFALGSVEYGVSILGADLILVLGHSKCGAVEAALKGMKFSNHIQEILDDIQPGIAEINKNSANALEKAIKANVLAVEKLLKDSKPVLADLLNKGSLKIFGAYYDLDTGNVEILDKP